MAGVPDTSEMNMRDYFAGQALTGLATYWVEDNAANLLVDPEEIAEDAYLLANAMLEERKKHEEDAE